MPQPPDNCALPDWARAYGPPVLSAALRSRPSDFQVVEELGFAPSGDGEHDLVDIEKTAANTAWVAGLLARHAGIREADVGFAGMKDRDAVTRQWFSVRRPNRDGTDWSTFAADGVRILGVFRHNRKLRRGAHRGNRFRIALRASGIDAAALRARLDTIREHGVPNYFGPQRFGRGGGNIELARSLGRGRRLGRGKRGIAISAARSLLYNEILDRRVSGDCWARLLPGDVANLDGSNSVFAIDAVTPELDARVRAADIHPTATLWGRGAPAGSGAAAALESDVVAACADMSAVLLEVGAEAASRATRLRVEALELELSGDVAWLSFRLVCGGFATAVLREIVAAPAVSDP